MTQLTHPLAADTWGKKERDAIIDVILFGERVTMWKKTIEFEAAFAKRLGVKYAVMVNSGSSANLIAVAALEQALQAKGRTLRGKVAVVPAIAWATTYAPLQQHGMRLRVVDVELDTLCVDARKVIEATCPETEIVVAVNILGNPCDLAMLRAHCDARGIYLLEDNCESLGADLGGRPCGAWGDIGTHSFFHSHHISTGEGGMIATNDDSLADLARCLRAHGWARDLPANSPLRCTAKDDFSEAYRFLMPGYNVRPTDIAAAVGLVQLARLDAAIAQRRRNAETFRALFGGDARFVLQQERSTAHSSWFGFTMIASNGRRAPYLDAMRRAGIEFRQITGGNFLQHPAASHYDYEVHGEGCSNARVVHDCGWFIGNHPTDLRPQLRRLHEVLEVLDD